MERIRGWPTENDVSAAKILDFFHGLLVADEEMISCERLELEKLLSGSKMMRDLRPGSETWLTKWLRQWNSSSESPIT